MTLDLSNPAMIQALGERAHRDLARIDLLEFIRYVREGYESNWHHEAICNALMGWIDGTGPERLMLFMPASNGKSEIVSRCLPAFLMGMKPCNVIACSHTQSLANDMSNDVREIMRGEEFRVLFGDKLGSGGAVEAWRTLDGSRYSCAGIGGPVTGKHFHYGIIDDPVKNSEEAFSETMREKAWQWYTRVFRTRRIGGNARMLLTTTRWHEDDLAGRILAKEPGKWHVLNFPAIAEHDEPKRRKGQPLWPARYPLEFLLEEKRINPHAFNALYQQRPVAEGGGMFKRQWFRYAEKNGSPDLYKMDTWRNVNDGRRFLTVDLAASTKESGDYTVIMAWAMFGEQLLLLDVLRDRLEGPDILPQIALMLNRWNAADCWIEKIGFQTTIIQDGSRKGLPVRELRPDKDKQTRAAPMAAAMANGKIWFAPGNWQADLEHELLSFPAGAHDDQVDAFAYGERVRHEVEGWQAERIAFY